MSNYRNLSFESLNEKSFLQAHRLFPYACRIFSNDGLSCFQKPLEKLLLIENTVKVGKAKAKKECGRDEEIKSGRK